MTIPPNEKPRRDFGEPIDLELLLGFADIDENDIPTALDWWDEHASEEWKGALEAPKFKGK
jgi:hypothetical protein